MSIPKDVLFDTSVWIAHFHATLTPGQDIFFVEALREDRVITTDIVIHELLIGTSSRDEYGRLKERLRLLRRVCIFPDHEEDFNEFAWHVRRQGFPAKYTDATIAYLAQRHGFPLWSFDGYFAKLAAKNLLRVVNIR